MSTNKSNKPELRFKGFSDDWEQRKFSDITYPSGEKNRDNLPYESYSITNESGFVPQDEKFENGGTMRDADKRMYYIVSPQSFAYNPARINIGSIGYQNTSKNVIVSSLYEIFRTTEEVDDRFLWHWFKSDDFQKLIVQLQEGGVRLYFYYDKLCMGSIALPSLAEQQWIGAYLDKLDNLITLHQRKYDNLKIIKKSMLDNLFPKNGEKVPKWRFKGFNNDWEQRKVYEIADRFDNLRVPVAANLRVAGDTPYYGANGIQDYVEGYTHDGEYVLIAEDGASDLKNYPVNYVNGRIWVNNHAHVLQGKNNIASNRFLSYAISLANIESVLVGGGRAKLNADVMMNLGIDLPTYKEQCRVAEYFSYLDNLITLHQSEVERLKKVKQFFLKKMFV